MPRAPRIDVPGLIYHITSRGNRRQPLFHDEKDYLRFLRFLSQTNHEYPFRLHAYCLMTNHYHLLLQTIGHSLSKTMHAIQTLYAKWFNRHYRQVGHVFEQRFHSIPVQEDTYFTTVSRYIHLNPVRARMVQKPEDYRWSNYNRLIKGEVDPLVDPAFLLGYFGNDVSKRREKYRLYVEESLEKSEPVNERVLRRMRYWGRPPR